jgi:protein SCO1/2
MVGPGVPRRIVTALLVLSALGSTVGLAAPAENGTATAVQPSGATSPRYLLMSPGGRAITSEDFRGRLQLVAFGFTSCPDVCPTTMLEMAHVLTALGTHADQVQPIFITVDPERDTADVLGAYAQTFDPRILGLTGSPALVKRAADSFGVQYEKVQEPGAPANVYTMDHSAGLYLLGPDGALLRKFGYGTSVADMVAPIQSWLSTNGR